MMRMLPNQCSIRSKVSLLNFFFITVLLLLSNICFAEGFPGGRQVIQIHGSQTIKHPTIFKDVTLDLTKGGFVIKNHASLDIENATVNVTISPSNPFFAFLTSGALTIKNSIFNVTVSGITPDPNTQSLFQLLKIQKGNVVITDSQFTVGTFYTVGFLVTDENFGTSGFQIINNKISNFHGGLYLANSNDAEIDNNVFANVSYSNIFYIGIHSNFKNNMITFPGNLFLGDAFDIFDSNSVILSNNTILSGSNYGIFMSGTQNVLVDNNKMSDGATYGMFIQTPSMLIKEKNMSHYFAQLTAKHRFKNQINSNITVSNNYFGQNRFGLAANTVTGLTVQSNIFIQKFVDDPSRLFWTNNANLLLGVTDLIWTNNLYKEAFTQEVPGNNIRSLTFVTFPASGGVTL